jgi:hypothetical protein
MPALKEHSALASNQQFQLSETYQGGLAAAKAPLIIASQNDEQLSPGDGAVRLRFCIPQRMLFSVSAITSCSDERLSATKAPLQRRVAQYQHLQSELRP